VHLNPEDGRAVKKLVYDSARGRVSVPMQFWRGVVAELQPDLALDIGANYGECFACTGYPPHTRVLVVEANPTLIPYLEKTRAAHPSSGSIRIVNSLVADRPREAQPFYFKPGWTGGGSAVAPENQEGYRRMDLPVDCIDRILQREVGSVSGKRLLLKADMEGYEGMMFSGFASLSEFRQVAGIFEFDTLLLDKAGTPAREVFERLAKRFVMFDSVRHRRLLRHVPDWPRLRALHPEGRLHTDLVFASSEALLPSGWTLSHAC
jgi:FkbM family methyltransferase